MARVDAAVRRETLFIAKWTAIFSAALQAVFLCLGRWDYTVLLGNLWGGGAAVLNFFLMGLTVQKAVLQEPKLAANTMRASQGGRLIMMFALAALGAALPWFNIIAVIVPMFFPRIAVFLRREATNDEKRGGSKGDDGAL